MDNSENAYMFSKSSTPPQYFDLYPKLYTFPRLYSFPKLYPTRFHNPMKFDNITRSEILPELYTSTKLDELENMRNKNSIRMNPVFDVKILHLLDSLKKKKM